MAKEKKEEIVAEPPKKLWWTYLVTWRFPNNLCASVPKSEGVIKGWLDARMPTAKPPDSKSIQEIQEEVASTMLSENIEQENKVITQRTALGFQAIEGNLVVRGGTIRAHLKDCARIVSSQYVGKKKGVGSIAWKITQGLYVEEYWVPILRPDGEPIQKPDSVMERMVHAFGPQGMMNALKAIDTVTNVMLRFKLKIINGISLTDLETIMIYGAIHGYAGERSTGEGRYIWEIKEIE